MKQPENPCGQTETRMRGCLQRLVRLEDRVFPEIYLSCWINHGCFGGVVYQNTSISLAVLRSKMELMQQPMLEDFWTPIMKGMEPYFYAGAQKKWVWMERVSINEPIPFIHRTVGVTREIKIHGVTVYWREPKRA